MTTANSESSTERIPGRAWTVRITAHGGRLAQVTCSTAACRMPPRSADLTALRTFAAQHAAAHAKVATVRPNAWCHCGSQRCGAHPDAKAYCAGAVVMILRHDPIVRRVWSVEEVSEMCAPLIPNATVLARAVRANRATERPAVPAAHVPGPARPSIAGGFSSAPTTAADSDPTAQRRSRRAPQRPRRRPSGNGH